MGVLQSARADGDGMKRPPGHLIMGAGREEVFRKGGGEEEEEEAEEEAVFIRCVNTRRREACDVCVMCVRPMRISSQPASSSEDRAGRNESVSHEWFQNPRRFPPTTSFLTTLLTLQGSFPAREVH